MSAPAYVVIPVEGDAAQTGEQENIQGAKSEHLNMEHQSRYSLTNPVASAIQRTIMEEIHPQFQHSHHVGQRTQRGYEKHNGPLKAMLG